MARLPDPQTAHDPQAATPGISSASDPAGRQPVQGIPESRNSRAKERILNALRRAPGLSKEEIAEQAFVALTTLSGGGYLKALRDDRIIFVSGWRRNGSCGFSTPLYSLGPGPDYPKPAIEDENRSAPGMQKLLDAIERHGPIDYRQAAALAGLAATTVKNAGYLRALVSQGKIHICGWRRARNGPMRPLYGFGGGAERPPLSAYTPAEKSRSYRLRKRATTTPATSSLWRLLLGSAARRRP